MMKKTYIAPTTETVQINMTASLLIVSGGGDPTQIIDGIDYDGPANFFEEGEVIA
jgi:hypothetical protein